MTTSAIVFSKDRPLQLHATLSSYYRHALDAEEASLYVIYKATSVEFAKGYSLIKTELPPTIKWIQETNFKHNLLDAIHYSHCGSGLLDQLLSVISNKIFPTSSFSCTSILFMVDDTIFTGPFSLLQINNLLLEHPDSIGFSLRLGRNTTYCYSHGSIQQLPSFIILDQALKFHWLGQSGDFGYPLEISSSVYRTTDIAFLLRKSRYINPNQLEQCLSASTKLLNEKHNSLLCFSQSVAFSTPINKVQSIYDNKSGSNDAYSSHALNMLLLGGHRIDIAKFTGYISNGAHQEVVLPFTITDY